MAVAASPGLGKRKDPPPETWPTGADGDGRWICFVRHAQALHNVYDENLWTPDNPLTEDGRAQCESAREEWGGKLFAGAELVVSSPMTRALQTADLISGSRGDLNWMVTPMCSEKLSGATCDEGRKKSEVVEELPWMASWNGVAELDDEWWKDDRPPEEERVIAFLDFLEKREEKRIVVVSHGAFLEYIVGYHLHNAHHHLMPVTEFRGIRQRLSRSTFNLGTCMVREYEETPLHDLLKAPLTCFKGIGKRKASLLSSLGVQTVEQLARWKYAKWAESICLLAPEEKEGGRDVSHTARRININKALDKEWEGWAMSFLLEAPPSAFEGLSEKHNPTFKALGISNIQDFGQWNVFKWARALAGTLSEVESLDGQS
ncbi:unnamed protein product [Prorocentrum cordatum]|uniref:Phosphoglycerate mutase-like protein n=1 Tax=Prorocentrum cordatum TaxID=2364126 RepID=A0ABN9V4I7_9DINO|nr:unnamed protein product [Polarella glacialis]